MSVVERGQMWPGLWLRSLLVLRSARGVVSIEAVGGAVSSYRRSVDGYLLS